MGSSTPTTPPWGYMHTPQTPVTSNACSNRYSRFTFAPATHALCFVLCLGALVRNTERRIPGNTQEFSETGHLNVPLTVEPQTTHRQLPCPYAARAHLLMRRCKARGNIQGLRASGGGAASGVVARRSNPFTLRTTPYTLNPAASDRRRRSRSGTRTRNTIPTSF